LRIQGISNLKQIVLHDLSLARWIVDSRLKLHSFLEGDQSWNMLAIAHVLDPMKCAICTPTLILLTYSIT